MCGISGVYLKAGENAERSMLEGMAEAMKRRGPDADGYFTAGAIGLAHRRLKIIDLSELANQPLFNEDGKVAVVFNGEIYNFNELRAELLAAGHFFRSRSDTEVIVHGFEEWGTGVFQRLNGIFALALWDGRRETPALHLARDRFGVKPLFLSHEGGRLAFASELKPLLTLPWIPQEIDPAILFQFLKFSHVPTPSSIFRGVKQLTPGAFLTYSAEHSTERLEERQFWDRRSASKPAWNFTEAEALIELDRNLTRAVERQLVADVPVGLFLSGGIDSSLLAAACEKLRVRSGQPIQSFSIGYHEAEFSEVSHARTIAEAFGTRHREWIVKPSDLFSLIPDIPLYFDQPFADPTLLPTLYLARKAREEVTVVLGGDGGDELFFGYPHQRALLFLSQLERLPAAPRKAAFQAVGDLANRWLVGGARKTGHRIHKLMEILQFGSQAELFQYFVGTIGPLRMDRLAALLREPVSAGAGLPFAPLMQELEDLPLEQRISQVFLRTFLVDTVLTKSDRATMAFGLEARVPFLDDDLVDFAARLPHGLKMKNGKSKYLLRRLLERKLAEKGVGTALSRRRKQGFSIPIRDWLRGDLKYLLDEYLAPERLKREGYFNGAEVHQLVREHLHAGANHSHLLWSLITFQMWKERYL